MSLSGRWGIEAARTADAAIDRLVKLGFDERQVDVRSLEDLVGAALSEQAMYLGEVPGLPVSQAEAREAHQLLDAVQRWGGFLPKILNRVIDIAVKRAETDAQRAALVEVRELILHASTLLPTEARSTIENAQDLKVELGVVTKQNFQELARLIVRMVDFIRSLPGNVQLREFTPGTRKMSGLPSPYRVTATFLNDCGIRRLEAHTERGAYFHRLQRIEAHRNHTSTTVKRFYSDWASRIHQGH